MALFFKVKFFPHIFSFAPAGMYWQNVERLRENVAVMCTAVWILEAVASLGTRWLTVPVIASDFTMFQFFQRKMLNFRCLLSFEPNLLVNNVVESWNAGKMA